METISLSVIIPVYKVEDTLGRCVESVLSQDVEGMEVILVDDGSPDCCPALCDDWAVRDPRVRVLHKENGGLSDARNRGIEMARGRYVTFVDSDDWLMPGTYRRLMLWLEGHPGCDMLEFLMRHVGGEGCGVRLRLALQDRIYRSARQYWLQTKAWEHSYAWNKIYRRTLFDDVRFPVGRVFEDAYTLPLLLAKEPQVATVAHGTYCYAWNGKGISVAASATAEGLMQHLDALRRAAQIMRTTPLSHNGVSLYYSMLCRQQGIYDITGRIVLPWPMVGLVCRMRAWLKSYATR